jgi:hypothetical protein
MDKHFAKGADDALLRFARHADHRLCGIFAEIFTHIILPAPKPELQTNGSFKKRLIRRRPMILCKPS